MLLVFLSLVEYAIILRRIVIHQRNLEKWRQEQIKEKKQDSAEVRASLTFKFAHFHNNLLFYSSAISSVTPPQRRWKWRNKHKGRNCWELQKTVSLKWGSKTNNLFWFWCRIRSLCVRWQRWRMEARNRQTNGRQKSGRIVVTSWRRLD